MSATGDDTEKLGELEPTIHSTHRTLLAVRETRKLGSKPVSSGSFDLFSKGRDEAIQLDSIPRDLEDENSLVAFQEQIETYRQRAIKSEQEIAAYLQKIKELQTRIESPADKKGLGPTLVQYVRDKASTEETIEKREQCLQQLSDCLIELVRLTQQIEKAEEEYEVAKQGLTKLKTTMASKGLSTTAVTEDLKTLQIKIETVKTALDSIKRKNQEYHEHYGSYMAVVKAQIEFFAITAEKEEGDPEIDEAAARLQEANKALAEAEARLKLKEEEKEKEKDEEKKEEGKEEEKEEETDPTGLHKKFEEFNQQIATIRGLNYGIYSRASEQLKREFLDAFTASTEKLQEISGIVNDIDDEGLKRKFLCDIAVASYEMAVEDSVYNIINIMNELRALAMQPASSELLSQRLLEIERYKRNHDSKHGDTVTQLEDVGQIRDAFERFTGFLKHIETELETIRKRDPSTVVLEMDAGPLGGSGLGDDIVPNPTSGLLDKEEEEEEEEENADEEQSSIPKQQLSTKPSLFVQIFSRLGNLEALLDEANIVINDANDDEQSIANAKRVAIAVDEALSKRDDSTKEKKLLKGKLLIAKYNLLIKEQNREAKHLVEKIKHCAGRLEEKLAKFIELDDSYRKELTAIAAATWRYQQQIKNFQVDAEKLNDKIEEDKKNILAALKGFKDLENPRLEVNILYREQLATETTGILLDIQDDENTTKLLFQCRRAYDNTHPTLFSPRLRALDTWSELERGIWASTTCRRLLDYTPEQIANDDNLFVRYQEAILILNSDLGDIEDRSATAVANNIIKASARFLLKEEEKAKLVRWSQNGSFYGSQKSDATDREMWKRAEQRKAEHRFYGDKTLSLTVVAVEELTGVVSFYVVFLNPQQKWMRAPLLTFIKTHLKLINTSDEAVAIKSIQQALSSAEEDPRYALSYQYGGIAQEVAIELEKASHLFSRQGLKYRASVSKFVDSVKASSESIRKQRQRESDSVSESLSLIGKALLISTVRRSLLVDVYKKDTQPGHEKAASEFLKAQQEGRPVDTEAAAYLDSLSFMPGRNEYKGYTIVETPKAITMTKEKKDELGNVKKTVEIILDTGKSEEATHVRIKNAKLDESEKATCFMAKKLKTPGIISMYIEVKKGECDSDGKYINVAERERVHISNLLEKDVVAVLRRYDNENEKSALWKTYKKLCLSTDAKDPDLHIRYLAKIFEDKTGRLQNELITGMFIENGKETIQGQTQAELKALIETDAVALKFILSKQAGTQNIFARFFHCASRATSMDRTGADISLRRQ